MNAIGEPHDEIRIEGPLRAPATTELQHEVEALLRRGDRRIVLNLAGVSDLDAAGLGELVRAYNTTAAANGVLRIAHSVGKARELIARVGLLDLLDEDLNADEISTAPRSDGPMDRGR